MDIQGFETVHRGRSLLVFTVTFAISLGLSISERKSLPPLCKPQPPVGGRLRSAEPGVALCPAPNTGPHPAETGKWGQYNKGQDAASPPGRDIPIWGTDGKGYFMLAPEKALASGESPQMPEGMKVANSLRKNDPKSILRSKIQKQSSWLLTSLRVSTMVVFTNPQP